MLTNFLKVSLQLTSLLALRLPVSLRHAIGNAIGLIFYYLLPTKAAIARQNYAYITGSSPNSPKTRMLTRKAYKNYGKMISDFIAFQTADLETIDKLVETKNLEYLDQALSNGNGAIMATIHMGNWEVGVAAAAAKGYPLAAVVDHFPLKALDELVFGSRITFGLRLIPYNQSAPRAILKALQDNMVVALVCDLTRGQQGIPVKIFGGKMEVPPGPVAIALRYDVPLIPGVVVYKNEHFLAEFAPPINIGVYKNAQNGINAAAQALFDIFKEFIMRYPDQWYVFMPVLSSSSEM